jgi:hypothetical protein
MAKVELDIPSYLRAGRDNLPVGEVYVKDNVEEGTLGDIISGFGKTKPVKMADMPAQPKVFDEQEPMIDELERTPLPGAPNMPILPPRTPDINVMPQAPSIPNPKTEEIFRIDSAQLPKDDILIS